MEQQLKDKKLLYSYNNGNVYVELYDDGTKIKTSDDDFFAFEYANTVDMKLTNRCSLECVFCHEDSTREGLHGRTDYDFLFCLPEGMEVALGGGNLLEFEGIIEFLEQLKRQKVVVNITINQFHFEEDQKGRKLIDEMIEKELIYGLGISFNNYSEEFIKYANKYKERLVLHVINGIVTLGQLEKLYGQDFKILILGYKFLRRGESYFNPLVTKRQRELYDNIHAVMRNFKIVSFDNLGIEQINLRRLLLKNQWDLFFQGLEGENSMYIDLQKGEFAQSSTSLERFPIMNDIRDMFKLIQVK